MGLQGSLLAFCITLLGLPSQSITSLKQQKCLVSQFLEASGPKKGVRRVGSFQGCEDLLRPLAGFQGFKWPSSAFLGW